MNPLLTVIFMFCVQLLPAPHILKFTLSGGRKVCSHNITCAVHCLFFGSSRDREEVSPRSSRACSRRVLSRSLYNRRVVSDLLSFVSQLASATLCLRGRYDLFVRPI